MIEVIPKTEKFIGDDGKERESTKAVLAFAGYYEDAEYKETFDNQLYNAYQPIKNEENEDDLIGEEEIPF